MKQLTNLLSSACELVFVGVVYIPSTERRVWRNLISLLVFLWPGQKNIAEKETNSDNFQWYYRQIDAGNMDPGLKHLESPLVDPELMENEFARKEAF